MARSYRSRHLAVMRDNERRMSALFAGLASYASGQVLRAADADGIIPRARTYELQRDIGDHVMRLFVARDRAGQFSPYQVLANGTVFPTSPYMRALWASIGAAMRIQVEQQAAMMERYLPGDIKGMLRGGVVREQGTVFTPNPLAGYDPPHLWVDPNGYTLSDRIWSTAGTTRRKVDAMLEDGIRKGRASRDMAKDLERFLAPGRQLVRTKAPYGTDASYDAMRLARTEISRAAAQAHETAARANPFVEKLRWKLSPQHPRTDICDNYADKEYSFDEFPTQPAHPHCMCYQENVMVENRREILDSYRDEIRAARRAAQPITTPLLVDQFIEQLMRGAIVTRALGMVV